MEAQTTTVQVGPTRGLSFGMALYSLHCADVPLRNCSLTPHENKDYMYEAGT